MAKLVARSFFLVTALFFIHAISAINNAEQQQCTYCADVRAKINNFVKNPHIASDAQIGELFAPIRIICFCDLSNIVEQIFEGAALKRIKKYFNDHPERLNDMSLLQNLRFGDKVVNSVASIIAEHIEKIKTSKLVTLTSNIAISGAARKIFFDALEKCQSTESIITLFVLIIREPKNGVDDLHNYGLKIIKKKLAVIFSNKAKALTFEYVFLLFLYKYINGSLPAGCSISSQTAQHLLSLTDKFDNNQNNYCGYSTSDSLLNYVNHKKPKKVVDQIIACEQKFSKAGYYTFVHGQRWQYRLAEQWYTWVWEVEQNRSAGDFQFVHCRKLKKEKIEKQREFRKRMIERGRIDDKMRGRLLFLNAPFFGNITNQGSCTALYAYQNANINYYALTLEEIFKMFDCTDVYTKYKSELEALEKEHESLSSKHGQVLLLAVPKKIIKDCVYAARPGGYKRSVVVDGKSTDDIEVILEALRTDASKIEDPDQIEFCLTLTDDMLTPDTGIKVRSLPMVDEAKIKAFDTKARKLFEQVKKELQKQFEKEKKVSRCIEQINSMLEKRTDKNIASLKEKIKSEILADLSDEDRNTIKQRMIHAHEKLIKVCESTNRAARQACSSLDSFIVEISDAGQSRMNILNLLTKQSCTIKHNLDCVIGSKLIFSSDHRYLIFCDGYHLTMWDCIANKVIKIDGNKGLHSALAAASDTRVAVEYEDNNDSQILIYELSSGKLVDLLKCSRSLVHKGTTYFSELKNIYISPDNKYLAEQYQMGNQLITRVVDLVTKKERILESEFFTHGFVTYNNHVCIIEQDGDLLLLKDIVSDKELKKINGGGGSLSLVKVSADKRTLMFLSTKIFDNTLQIHLFDLVSGQERIVPVNSRNSSINFTDKYIIKTKYSGTTEFWTYGDAKKVNLINQLFA